MTRLTSTQRKLIYLGCIILLMIPVILLGLPSAPETKSAPASAGGVLAQQRVKHDLGEQTLGQIDPSSSAMNLVLLGFRGPAACILWCQMEKEKETKNWAAMRATTESIITLQPHFRKVWIYNGWNLSYNVAPEWDDVRDRYYWVKEGAKFLKRSTERNQYHPDLFWYTGNTLGGKIGHADEWRQYRRFFREDPDPKWTVNDVPGPDKDLNPDDLDHNLAARVWFQRTNKVWDDPKGKNPELMARILMRGYPQRALYDYAGERQKEGLFNEETKRAWDEAFNEWTTVYGVEEYETPGGKVHLEWPAEQIDRDEPDSQKAEALKFWVGRYQDMTNYRYWRTRALAEREENTLQAHADLFFAMEAMLKVDTAEAERLAWSGLTRYEKIVADFDELIYDTATIDEIMLGHVVWRNAFRLNHSPDEPLPEEYPLKKLWLENQTRVPEAESEFRRRFTDLD